jgi:hypothetical protein
LVSIRAIDIAGNISAQSNTLTATTTVDTSSPSIPADFESLSRYRDGNQPGLVAKHG